MGVYRLGLIGLLSFSSLGVCAFCLFGVSGLLQIWFIIELMVVSVVPLFFLNLNGVVLQALISFVLVSSVSSAMVVSGFVDGLYVLVTFLGFFVKFGLFPFFSWVYKVVCNSNWLVVMGVSVFLKVPVFVLPVLYRSKGYALLVEVSLIFGFLFLAVAFWLYSYNLWYCWAHMMLSSTVALVYLSLACSFEWLCWVFIFYCVWSVAVICFIRYYGSGGKDFSLLGLVLFSFLFLVFPVSFGVSYKVCLSIALSGGGCPLVVVFWVVYSLSEQFYFFKVFSGMVLNTKIKFV